MIEPPAPPPPRRRSLWAALRASFLTGLVVLLPIGLTVYLIWSVVGWLDGWFLPLIPEAYHPTEMLQHYFGPGVTVQIRGVGVVVFLIITVLIGWIAKGLIGRTVIHRMEALVERMPVVRSLYSGLKQIAETVFNKTESSFDQTCLIEFPKPGSWCVGMVSARPKGEIAQHLPGGDEMVAVFVGLTPFTSGFLVFVPKKDVILLNMKTEDVAKLVVSGGIVYPKG